MGPTVEFIMNPMGGLVPAVVLVSLVAVTVYAFYALYMAAQYQAVRNSGLLKNNPLVAQNEFIRLLNKASKEMIIYDDGDAVRDSIYDNEKILEAVRDKLEHHPDFVIRCLFNCDHELLKFRQEFEASGSHVQIRTRGKPGRPSAGQQHPLPHFKIIDGGSSAHLSWHRPHSEARLYQTLDCSNLLRLGKKRVMRSIVGKYIDRFDQEFESGESVERPPVTKRC